jgi:pimeloyl-ACP methyl ester carboxylesterase
MNHATTEEFLAAEKRLYEAVGIAPRGTTLTIELGGSARRIRVVELGPADGVPLVWVHGGGGCGAHFARLLAHVSKEAPDAFRHIIVDRPGCGASDPFLYELDTDLEAHAVDFLTGVLDGLGVDRAHFVGNSMGGLWSLWFANARPERVRDVVLEGVSALLLDTSAPFGMRICAVPWIGKRLMRLDPGTREQAASVWARLGHPDKTRLGDELLDLTAVAARLPSWTEGFVSLLHRALRLRGPRISFTEAEWKRVKAPVHMVWGDRDPFGTVDSARRAVALRPETKLDIVKGAGHLPWLDDVDVCARAILGFAPERLHRTVTERAVS